MQFVQTVNGLEVEASYTDESVEQLFLPLLRRLTALQRERGRRILVMLAAPPAAGKSTLVSFLQQLSESDPTLEPLQAIGMDGFHHYQDYLLSHTVVRNGEEMPMVRVKGSPISFDLPLLTERIQGLVEGSVHDWPEYNRKAHNPIDHAITLERKIILLEGNYLLLDLPGWDKLKGYADYTVRIRARSEDVRERLIWRKQTSNGLTREETAAFVDFSDIPNVQTVLEHSVRGDLNLQMLSDGSYVADET